MPVWTADLIWLRLVQAARAHPRTSGDAEVLAWPSLHVADGERRDVLFSALYARVHQNDLETVARQRHDISLKTFRRRRKAACMEIAAAINARKWGRLIECEDRVCLESS
jgi:hypothetical protein